MPTEEPTMPLDLPTQGFEKPNGVFYESQGWRLGRYLSHKY
jgi:hypothetical protein